jgi:Protein of unknown function (DUF3489)
MARTAKSSSSSKCAAPVKSPKPSVAKPQAAARRQSSQTTPKNRIKSVQKPPASKTATSPKPPKTTKQSRLIELLQRPTGANISDLTDATGWQAHSIRGVISGILRKKLGLIIESQTNAHGIRMYRINPAAGAAK